MDLCSARWLGKMAQSCCQEGEIERFQLEGGRAEEGEDVWVAEESGDGEWKIQALMGWSS